MFEGHAADRGLMGSCRFSVQQAFAQWVPLMIYLAALGAAFGLMVDASPQHHNAWALAMITLVLVASTMRAIVPVLWGTIGRYTFMFPRGGAPKTQFPPSSLVCAKGTGFMVSLVVDSTLVPLVVASCRGVLLDVGSVVTATHIIPVHPPHVVVWFWAFVLVVGLVSGIGGYCVGYTVLSSNPYEDDAGAGAGADGRSVSFRMRIPALLISWVVVALPIAIGLVGGLFPCDAAAVTMVYDSAVACHSTDHVAYCVLGVISLLVLFLPPYHMAIQSMRNLNERSESPRSQQPLVHPLYLEWSMMIRLGKLVVMPVAAVVSNSHIAVVLATAMGLDMITFLATLISQSTTSVESLRWLVTWSAGSQSVLSAVVLFVVTARNNVLSSSDAVYLWWAMYVLAAVSPWVAYVVRYRCVCSLSHRDEYFEHDSDVYEGEARPVL